MILTCPACGTQYMVKDGAIPPEGRQVRCAACKHSWHQDPEEQDAGPAESAELHSDEPEVIQEPDSEWLGGPDRETGQARGEPDDYAEPDESADPGDFKDPEPEPEEHEEVGGLPPPPPVSWTEEPATDDEFSPFPDRSQEPARPRGPLTAILLVALALIALAAAFWFLAPPEWRERTGLAEAATTSLQLQMTHSDRQRLAIGNELLAVSGRVINPTDERQPVPPIRAELRSTTGQLVHSWTIAPPAPTLPPGGSAVFNSAEVDVPPGGDELTISLGSEGA